MLKSRLENKITWQSVYASAVLFLLSLFLLMRIAPQRGADIYAAYASVLLGVMAGIYFTKCGLKGPAELKLYLVFSAWVLLSRWLNRDIYLLIDKELVLTALTSFLVLAAPLCLNKTQRAFLLDLVTILYGGLFLITAILGLFVYISDTYIHLPPENVWITIKQQGSLYSLNLLSAHRLLMVAHLFMAYILFVYQFIKRKGMLSRSINLIFILILHIAIALCHSRTTHIAMSGGAAILVMMYLIPKAKKLKPLPQKAAICAGAGLALVLCFFSFDVCNTLVTKAHHSLAPAFEEFYNGLERKPNEEYFGLRSNTQSYQEEEAKKTLEDETATPQQTAPSAKDTLTASDNRKLVGNWTLTGRTEIWHAGIVSMIRQPSKLLIGQSTKNCMQIVNNVLREYYPAVKEYKMHMHSAYMQVFMFLGIPGLLLALAWTLLMVKDMLKLFFSKKEVSLEAKIAILALAVFFIINLAEPFIFTTMESQTILFLIFSGTLIAEYREHFYSN